MRNVLEYAEFDMKNKKASPPKTEYKFVDWETEVYRNTHNLCVVCGEPMTTRVFHDVPVCDKHKDIRGEAK